MINNKVLYSLSDVSIIPSAISTIQHRSECIPYYQDGMLPVFTSPMPCVVNMETLNVYNDCKINPIIPRTTDFEKSSSFLKTGKYFVSLSLNDFKELFNVCTNKDWQFENAKVLIDIANGNMESLMYAIQKAKELHPNIRVMAGNIANPETFLHLSESGADYVRLSVGTGSGCITTTSTGIYYPMASLIDECYRIKEENNLDTNIIADGGIYEYRDAIKCLALGADYVMMGSRLAACEDSAADFSDQTHEYKQYYGMASNLGMEKLGKSGTREGKEITIKVNGTIQSFSIEFGDYLRSAMSYCNKKYITDFIGEVNVGIISNNSSKQFNQTR